MRDQYIDALKGFCILAVIVIHSCVTDRIDPMSAQAANAMVIRAITNFAVATFFLLSGVLNGQNRGEKNGAWIWRRLAAIVPPYVVWTIVYTALLNRERLFDPGHLAFDLLTGMGINIGYFVVVLVQFIILTPLIDRISSIRSHLAIILSLSLLAIAFTYINEFKILSVGFPYPYNIIFFPIWYPFYHLGYVMSKFGYLQIDRATYAKPALFAAMVALGLSVFEGFVLRPYNLAWSQLKATSVLYSLTVCIALFAWRPRLSRMDLTGLAWLGRNSYFIYLTHLIPIKVAAAVAPRLGLGQGQFAYIGLLALLPMVLCPIGIVLGRRILPPRAQKWIMG